MNLRIFDGKDDLIAGTARAILDQIEKGARTIALSGGSTPQPLYEQLGQNDSIRELPVTWVVVDERYVPAGDPQSNEGMMRRTLFARGMSPSHRFLRFHTELKEPAATAREFERDWKAAGIEQLDLILLGMGDDGHTASLFPGTAALDVRDRIATEVFVPRLDSWRVTVTLDVIRTAKMRFVLVAGSSKAPVMKAIGSGSDFPITRATENVVTWWFCDRESVRDLPTDI
jgi:6-phosphogluconolactonase